MTEIMFYLQGERDPNKAINGLLLRYNLHQQMIVIPQLGSVIKITKKKTQRYYTIENIEYSYSELPASCLFGVLDAVIISLKKV